jgi:hypothetical protein
MYTVPSAAMAGEAGRIEYNFLSVPPPQRPLRIDYIKAIIVRSYVLMLRLIQLPVRMVSHSRSDIAN